MGSASEVSVPSAVQPGHSAGARPVNQVSYSAFAESLETEVYGSCPWNAAAATAGEQLWFEDCLAVLNGTIAQCAFQGCATCGHYATCGDLEASPAPYADCVTCPDGYEVDVVYEASRAVTLRVTSGGRVRNA